MPPNPSRGLAPLALDSSTPVRTTWRRHCSVSLLNLDTPGQYLRICFLDFSKAFDRINLNILVTKLVFLGVRRSLLPWIFRHAVFCQIANNELSWVNHCQSGSQRMHAGVPQGTKLGPILFLVLINDLVLPTRDYWKYVDDLTASEVIAKYGNSTIQSDLDYISSWSSANYMKLNAKKCNKRAKGLFLP